MGVAVGRIQAVHNNEGAAKASYDQAGALDSVIYPATGCRIALFVVTMFNQHCRQYNNYFAFNALASAHGMDGVPGDHPPMTCVHH
ncbi:hypothetical protein RvY_02285 [Ramazzottius varieornatus]|uniref:Uncharacterized protein n=1 Tax=Ramazzottius varieornatus TaxID=947166 RepID=A0A1D1UJ60_RAMVA|nr:hypothetical protein RvY_02285 [Ramazzottius varieornatus]